MLDDLVKTSVKHLSQKVSRRNFLYKAGKILLAVTVGQTIEAAFPKSQAQAYHTCSTCRYCNLCGKPCTNCGSANIWDPCPSGTVASGSWYGCCYCSGSDGQTRWRCYRYQDCCGKSDCNSVYCTNGCPRSPYSCYGGYWCTRVRELDCTNSNCYCC